LTKSVKCVIHLIEMNKLTSAWKEALKKAIEKTKWERFQKEYGEIIKKALERSLDKFYEKRIWRKEERK